MLGIVYDHGTQESGFLFLDEMAGEGMEPICMGQTSRTG
jgi:hypothetical protein